MKKLFVFIDTCLVMASILTVTTVIPDSKSVSIKRINTFVDSSIITKEVAVQSASLETKEEVSEEKETTKEETKQVVSQTKEEVKKEVEEVKPISNDTNNNQEEVRMYYQGEIFTAKMSGYGADIGNYTASGYQISGGNITYNDNQYGEVRILAGDRNYPFGTIVRISNSNEGTVLGIVLDRGPDIGRGTAKKFAFDLLYTTSREARLKGVSYNANFEILRLGY
ncbi:MAG: hypothetical protein PUB03_05880 [bacterium]|nr:hypothetical protein [bacterium]